jgi:hypothetical protein
MGAVECCDKGKLSFSWGRGCKTSSSVMGGGNPLGTKSSE